MKIMSLVWYNVLPAHFGGQKGIAEFNQALGQQGSLVCLCSKNNTPRGNESYGVFNWLPNSKWQIVNPLMWFAIIRFAKKQQITHVIIEHPYYSITGWLLKALCNCTIITHCHNVEHLLFKTRKRWYWPAIKLLETLACSTSSVVICKTIDDQQQLVKHCGLAAEKCMIIPFCTELKDITGKQVARRAIQKQFGLDEGQKILLFNGTLDYEPNARAVAELVQYLCPLLPANYTIIITGRNEFKAFARLKSLQANNFIMAGYVYDIDNYFLAADVYINPVMDGGGMQTKNIEALSYHLPVVCWQNRLQGIEDELTGSKIIVAKPGSWNDFLARVLIADIIPEQTPQHFFIYYNFAYHIRLLINRLIRPRPGVM